MTAGFKPIKNIVVPTDFSKNSNLAMQYALYLARMLDAEIFILHVIDNGSLSSLKKSLVVSPPDQFRELFKIIRRNANQYMDKFMNKLNTRGVKINKAIVRGVPFIEIVRHAKRKDADLIVMGTRGVTGLQSILIGSTAEKVVRKSYCPVLTIKGGEFTFRLP